MVKMLCIVHRMRKQTTYIGIKLSPELKARAEKAATKQRQGLSEWIRWAIIAYLPVRKVTR